MEEVWKDIAGYEGLYQVSNYGLVKSLDRYEKCGKFIRFRKGKILKYSKNTQGYLQVCLSKNGIQKTQRINRIEAITFELPIPEELKHIPIEELEVEHIDANKENNRLDNLRWNTRKGNMENPITRQRISNTRKGMKFTEEHRRNMSEVRKGKYNTKKSKPVLQINKDTNEVIAEFPSAKEVQRQLGYYSGYICSSCNGKYKSAYGYKWQYA